MVKTLVELARELDPQLSVSGFVTDEVLRGGARVGFDVVSVRAPAALEQSVSFLAAGLCLANVVATLLECGLGPCCENGPCP